MLRCISVLVVFAYIQLLLILTTIDPYPIGILPPISEDEFASSSNKLKINLTEWLSRYPLIEPQGNRRCNPWKCQPTFNHTTNKWLDQHIAMIAEGPWREAHKSQSEELLDPNQQCQYVFIGDSITYRWRDNQQIFDRNFNQNRNGVIYAQGGDKIHEIGWRLNQGDGFKNMKECLSNNKSPQKSIVLLIGTNDMGWNIGYDIALRDYNVLLNQFAEFLEDINKEQKVVLNVMAIFPRGYAEIPHWNMNNTMFERISFMNEYLKSFIERQDNDNMRFIDCNGDLLQNVGSLQWTDFKGGVQRLITGYINTAFLPDRLHLSATGYKLWAECLKKHLK